MDRRKFMQQGILGVSAFSVMVSDQIGVAGGGVDSTEPQRDAGKHGTGEVTAGDVQSYLRGMGAAWIDPEKTVDTFKAGDESTVITGIAVGWMSYLEALKRARELACNVFITHEPTYYDHYDREQSVFAFDTAKKKREFIRQSGMAIIRCHDVWDRVPEIGIRDAWAGFLGLDKEISRRISSDGAAGRPFCGVYEIPARKAEEYARHVATKLAGFGQNTVQLIGPADKLVRSVAVGTGAITPFREMVSELQADLVICTDDGFSFWADGSLAIDMEYPVIVVNHPCSEEIGVRRLAGILAEKYPQVPVHHLPQTCMFRSITAVPNA